MEIGKLDFSEASMETGTSLQGRYHEVGPAVRLTFASG